MENYRKCLSKAAGIIQDMAEPRNAHLLQGHNTPYEMWIAIQKRYEDTSPMNAGIILHEMAYTKLADCSSVNGYCKDFQAAYDRILSLLRWEDSALGAPAVEVILQTFLLKNLTSSYAPLVSQLRRDWKVNNTDLQEAMSAILHYRVDTEMPKTLAAQVPWTPKKRPLVPYENPICIQKELRLTIQRKDISSTTLNYVEHPRESRRIMLRHLESIVADMRGSWLSSWPPRVLRSITGY